MCVSYSIAHSVIVKPARGGWMLVRAGATLISGDPSNDQWAEPRPAEAE
jgi:hypothetical protein